MLAFARRTTNFEKYFPKNVAISTKGFADARVAKSSRTVGQSKLKHAQSFADIEKTFRNASLYVIK